MTNLKYFLSTLAMVILFGCGTVQVKEPAIMAQTHGYLVGSMHADYAVGIELESEKGKLWSVPAPSDFRPTKTIETWIPAGTYTLKNILGLAVVGSDKIAVSEEAFPKVVVKAGEITDLNHLIPFNMGEGKYTVLSLKRNEAFQSKGLLEVQDKIGKVTLNNWYSTADLGESKIKFASSGLGLIPDLINNYSKKRAFSEKLDLLAKANTHEKAFDIVKSLSTPSTLLQKNKKGEYFFGTNTGQIRYFSGENWNVIDTGYLEGVMGVVYLDNEHLIVGLESGTVIESKDNGINWKQLAKVNPNELIFDIKMGQDGIYIGTWIPDPKTGTQFFGLNQKITPTAKLYLLKGGELLEKSIIQGTGTYTWAYKPSMFANDNFIYITLPPKTIYAYDANSQQGHPLAIEKYFTGVEVNSDQDILTRWFAGGLRSNAFYSTDAGQSWVPLPKPPYQPRNIYLDEIGKGRMWSLATGLINASFKLEKLDASGKKWEDVKKFEVDCLSMLIDYASGDHFCVQKNGIIESM